MSSQPKEITPSALQSMLKAGVPVRLIDCREPGEFAFCRLPDAELLPLGELGGEWSTRFADRAQSIVIYCHHGFRSMRAARFLHAKGFTDVSSLGGGIDAWSRLVDPNVPRYGEACDSGDSRSDGQT